MIMTQKSGWTKAAVIDALEVRTGQRLSKRDIVINASAKEMAWAKEEARREYRGGVFCFGYGDTPDAIVYAEREPYEDALSFITYVMIRAGRVGTTLIDDIADAIF